MLGDKLKKKKMDKKNKAVDEYMAAFPKDVVKLLEKVRTTIQKAAPKAEERICWKMPAYYQDGLLILFAGHKKHIGIYPMPGVIKAFKKELEEYEVSKGGIQFPYEEPLPLGLIKRITKYRIKENQFKAKAKKAKRKP